MRCAKERGVWDWEAMPAGDGGASRGTLPTRRRAPAARHFVVCGLLLLALPGSSTNQPSAAHRPCAEALVAPLAGCRGASSKLPSFVGSWAQMAPGHAMLQLCRRAPASCERIANSAPMLMVSVQPRPGASGESRPRREGRRNEADAVAEGVNASFKSVFFRASRHSAGSSGARTDSTPEKVPRRRGIGSRLPPQPVRAPAASQKTVNGDHSMQQVDEFRGQAASRTIGGGVKRAAQPSGVPEEFLNQVAIRREAARRLLEKADDMAGGSRLGLPGPAPQRGLTVRQTSSMTGYKEGEESITDATVVERNTFETYEYSEEVESDWEMQKKSVFKQAGAKGRWKSRLRSMRPEGESPAAYTHEEASYVVETQRQRELNNKELMRKVTMLTKGRRRGVEAALQLADEGDGDRDLVERELFLNPGFIEMRRRENELAATQGGSSSGIPLAELGRRGLVGPSMSPQDLHRGANSIEHELVLAGVAFDLQVAGNRLYSGGSDNCVTIYDTETWEKLGVLQGHEGWVNAIVVDTDRNLLYSASQDTTVKVWDLASHTCICTLEGHDEGAISLQVVGSRLVVGCSGKMLVWDTVSWKVRNRLSGHTQVLRAMSDGKQMSKNLDIDPRLAIAREAANLAGTEVGGLACSKHHMFSAVDQGSVWVWEKNHLEVERKLLGPRGTITEPVWVRSLKVIQVRCPETGKPREKL